MTEEKVFDRELSPSFDENKVEAQEEMSEAQKIKSGICPSCGGGLVFQEGCKVCYSCGWGGCG